ncbi:MAG: FAD:protein FMN transferase [Woeseiaceae bacterium]|nr:FAD:protein FMN transferase [Woeseiaceae bacterium]
MRRALGLFCALMLAACGSDRLPQLELTGTALGTTFKVAIVDAPEGLDTDALEANVVATLATVDGLASTWRDDSELSTLNANPSSDWILVSAELCDMLDRALSVSKTTGGAFDVTVGPLVNLWGFGPDGPVNEPPSDESIAAALVSVGHDKIEADCDAKLVRKDVPALYVDLSGWAKGHAVDELAALLDQTGLGNYLVEVGGEIRVKGHNSEGLGWAVAVEAPTTSERLPQAVVRISDTSVATSGDYRNYFEYDGSNYSHTIDPRTGRPVAHNLAAVTVIDPSTAYADAMATALLVLGPEAGPKLAGELDLAAYFLVREAGAVRETTTTAFDRLGTQ